MNPLTAEWVEKAEGDYAMVRREVRSRTSPSYDGACFHAQQCAEKYLKGRLQEAGIAFPFTHNLIALLNLALPVEPTWQTLQASLQVLTVYAVQYRYPGFTANRADAHAALQLCKQVRATVRLSLNLPV